MLEVSDANFKQKVLKSEKPVVVDFWAEWCGPCRQLSPILEELEKEFSQKVVFAKLNVDENPDVAGSYGITSIPTMLVFENGNLSKQVIGALPKKELASRLGLSS